MSKIIEGLTRRKVLFGEILFFLLGLIGLTTIQYLRFKSVWDPAWLNYFSNIITALMAGVAVGIFFELFVRREQSKELMQLVDLKEELRKSGIIGYYSDFQDIDLRRFFDTAKHIDLYFSYGSTLISQLSPTLEKKFMDENAEIRIFFLADDNPSLGGLGSLWGKYSAEYQIEGLRKKIQGVKNRLLELLEKVKQKSDKIASVSIFALKYHHVSYSFYRFDDTIILSPTKLTEDKNVRPIALICKKTNAQDIYSWCMSELEFIKHQSDGLQPIIQTES